MNQFIKHGMEMVMGSSYQCGYGTIGPRSSLWGWGWTFSLHICCFGGVLLLCGCPLPSSLSVQTSQTAPLQDDVGGVTDDDVDDFFSDDGIEGVEGDGEGGDGDDSDADDSDNEESDGTGNPSLRPSDDADDSDDEESDDTDDPFVDDMDDADDDGADLLDDSGDDSQNDEIDD